METELVDVLVCAIMQLLKLVYIEHFDFMHVNSIACKVYLTFQS